MKTLNPNIWPFIWRLILFFATVIAICFMLYSCNPVKQAQKQADNAEKQRAALAKLCAEQFPLKPEIKYLPGEVDTAGLWKWLNEFSIQRDSNITNVKIDSIERKFQIYPGNTILLQVDSEGHWSGPLYNKMKDSLIRALKRFIKPDTFYKSTPDTFALVSLKYDLKIALKKNNELQIENRDDKVIIAEWKGKARTRQWIIIAIIGIGVIGIVAKFKGGSILKLFRNEKRLS